MDRLMSGVTFVLYALTLSIALLEYLRIHKINIAFHVFLLSVTANVITLIMRGLVIGHLPFVGRFEATMIYTSMSAVVVLGLILIFKSKLLILYITPLLLIICLVALTGPQASSVTLTPALKTPLFGIHVALVFLGYAFYTTNFCLAVFTDVSRDNTLCIVDRSVQFGAIFLGAGIAVGAYWAHLSWGNWWSWDPKETWALITLFCYLIFLHIRTQYRPRRWLVAIFLYAGYASLVVTFLGINLLQWTSHSY